MSLCRTCNKTLIFIKLFVNLSPRLLCVKVTCTGKHSSIVSAFTDRITRGCRGENTHRWFPFYTNEWSLPELSILGRHCDAFPVSITLCVGHLVYSQYHLEQRLSSIMPLIFLPLSQWFSTFLMWRPFNTVPCVVVNPQPQNYFHCYFITLILPLLWIVNILGDRGLSKGSQATGWEALLYTNPFPYLPTLFMSSKGLSDCETFRLHQVLFVASECLQAVSFMFFMTLEFDKWLNNPSEPFWKKAKIAMILSPSYLFFFRFLRSGLLKLNCMFLKVHCKYAIPSLSNSLLWKNTAAGSVCSLDASTAVEPGRGPASRFSWNQLLYWEE